MRFALSIALLATLSACAAPTAQPLAQRGAGAVSARAALAASVLAPEAVPAAVVKATLGPAQATADDASRRRQIDFFGLHPTPIGLRIGNGPDAAYVLSYLGTSKERNDLNIEMRALLADGKTGFHYNYSGPVTLGRAAGLSASAAPRKTGDALSFELIFGLPGDGVAEAYSDYMEHLGGALRQRYGARPFSWDDGPIIFAVHQGEAVTGFVFTNQTNRLVLGDRKYADVQQVAYVTTEAEVAAAYTVVAFNPKTGGAGAPLRYELERDKRLGTIATCGER